MRKMLLVTAIFSIICGSAAGFDGKRKGFVLGGGIGFSPYIHWSVENDLAFGEDDAAGAGVNFIIGYAWDEQNMIVYDGQGAAYAKGDATIAQGGSFASWYHYFGPAGKSFFTTVGLGLYTWQIEDIDANEPGAAFMFGGGYEFSRHWQVGVYISGGKSTLQLASLMGSSLDFDMTHTTLNVLIGGVAF